MKAARAKTIPARLLESLVPAVVDSAMDAVILVDESQRIILFNAAAGRMFQCRPLDALGQKLDRFLPERYRAAHPQHVTAFGRTGHTTRKAGRLGTQSGLRADGEEFPVEVSISHVEVAGKKYFTAILRDMAERLRAEESHSRLAAIVESSSDAIIGENLEGVVTSWNHGAEMIFGYSPEEIVGQSFERLMPPDRLDEEKQILRRIRRGERVKRFDTVRRHKDGRLIDVSVTISPIKDASRRVVGASKVARDIIERKRGEMALRRREEYFRSLIEYASDLITLVDETGVIHFQSPSVGRILNWKADRMAARNISEFIHPEDQLRLMAMIRRALAKPEAPVSLEYRLRHHDGAWHLFSAVGRSIPHGADGQRVVFNSRDITASRNLEEQLLQAQKMEAVGTLAGGIAHDFNNVLAGILGSAELVREDLGANHPSLEYVQAIMTAALRARGLVQQILTFSRRHESEKQVVPLQPIVGECIKLLRSTIPAMVEISHYVDSQCPPVLADPTQIHQVIMNICTNAWHALPETGGHINISLRAVVVDADLSLRHRVLRQGPCARLTITDNGHGMNAETRERIFEPFFTTKPANKGSGLGLSVVHGIVRAHRGAIAVESEPGQGTTFHVYLPAQPVHPQASALPMAAVPHGHGERVLLVDDEPIVGRSAEVFLQRLGYTVVRCEQSEAALARFREAPQDYDLIISDWAMPGMSGLELVAAMRETRPDIPMLLMSGFVGAWAEKTVKTLGVGKILVKPVNPDAMAQTVALLLSRAAAARVGKASSANGSGRAKPANQSLDVQPKHPVHE